MRHELAASALLALLLVPWGVAQEEGLPAPEIHRHNATLTVAGQGYASGDYVIRLYALPGCDASAGTAFIAEATARSELDGRVEAQFQVDPNGDYVAQVHRGTPDRVRSSSPTSACSDAGPTYGAPPTVRSFSSSTDHGFDFQNGPLSSVQLAYATASEATLTVQPFADASELPPPPDGFDASSYGFDLTIDPPPSTGSITFDVPARQFPEGPPKSWRMLHHDGDWEVVPVTVQMHGDTATITMDLEGLTYSPFVLAGQPGFEAKPARGPWFTIGGAVAGFIAVSLCVGILVMHFRR